MVILSGDQLYRMDLKKIIQAHVESGADLTISTKPVSRKDAPLFGIMQVDKDLRITHFAEKPADTPELDALRMPTDEKETYLASMGIYVFNTQVLKKLLDENDASDFGKHIIPNAIQTQKVYSYIFDDYWEDIGTIRSFWEANLALTDDLPDFSFYDMDAPIYTNMRYLPPSKINRCDLDHCLLSDGCIITARRIKRAVIGLRAVVGKGTEINNSIVMGSDFYKDGKVEHESGIACGIGENCFINNAIIDKNVRIGNDVTISPENKPANETTSMYRICDGIIVIPKGTVIPSGTVL